MTVKGYVDRVEVVERGQVVARHARSYGRDEQVLDPLHYLAALRRRPAALDHAPVLRDWQLPESFTRLRQRLEERHGRVAGGRHFVRVLLLLAEHPHERVQAGRGSVPAPRRSARRARRSRGAAAGGRE